MGVIILVGMFGQEALAQNSDLTPNQQSANSTERFIIHEVNFWGTYTLYIAIGIAAVIVGLVIWKRRRKS